MELYLTEIAKNSYEIFAIQILGNMAIQDIVYARHMSNCKCLMDYLINQFNESRNIEERNEICITLRNIVYHRDAEITWFYFI